MLRFNFNKQFSLLDGENLLSISKYLEKIHPALRHILAAKVITVSNCYYFDFALVNNLDSFAKMDSTGRECLLNKIYLEDYLTEGISPDNFFKQGIWFSKALAEKLALLDLGSFEVIMSYDESCTIRFHKQRQGESYLDSDLNSYSMEALLTISF